jgi:hypothetical protein
MRAMKGGKWRVMMLRAGVCLLLGVCLTVAVSWAIAVWGATDGNFRGKMGMPGQFDWPVKAPAEWEPPRRVAWAVGRGVRFDGGAVAHQYAPTGPWYVASGVRYGWPVPAMQWRVAFVAKGMGDKLVIPTGMTTGVKLPGQPIHSVVWYAPSQFERRLPLLPVWPGFAVSTVLYASLAAAVWLLCRARSTLRRRHRIRRGLCLACGYAVGGLPICPECGRSKQATLECPDARTSPSPE